MKSFALILALLLLLTSCGQTAEEPPAEETDDYEALIAATPVAQVEGETVSPDGRFEVRAEGASGQYVSGIQPPEFVQIVDRETGEVLWQTLGGLWQSALWREDSGMVALAWSARTWCSITIIETENWTSWDFTLPDGSPIPEYTFLPYDEPWGTWKSGIYLDMTIGRGGDGGEQQYYTCVVNTRDGKIEGNALRQTREILPGSYDFDHDGKPEIVELVKDYPDEDSSEPYQYRIQIRTEDNRLFWSQFCYTSHVGWGTYFACRIDGEDYLLEYNPTMYQGFANYTYQLYSLTENGKERAVRGEGNVEFDINFGSPIHQDYDPETVAAFLEEVRGLLEDSQLLLSTENGEFHSGGSGVEFLDSLETYL